MGPKGYKWHPIATPLHWARDYDPEVNGPDRPAEN